VIFILITFILFLAYAFETHKKETKKTATEHVTTFFAMLCDGILGFFVGILIYLLLGNTIGSLLPYNTKLLETYKIVNIDETHMEYVVKTNDGFDIFNTKDKNVHINYITTGVAHIDSYYATYDNDFDIRYLIAYPSDYGKRNCYELYIPKH